MAIALLALIFIAIIAWEVPGLVRKKCGGNLQLFLYCCSSVWCSVSGRP